MGSEGFVRGGGGAFAFVQNGDLFVRKAVRVLYEDRTDVVLADDGSLPGGQNVVLDEVGMEMWKVLRANGDVDAARAALLEQYDVAEDVLAKDLDELIAKLAERKLLLVADE